MSLFLRYLKQNLHILVLYLLCLGILWLCFYLYALPMEPMVYMSALCTILLSVYGLYAFGKMKKRCRLLQNIQDGKNTEVYTYPAFLTILEQEEYRIITLLQKEHTATVREYETRYRNMVDYYTVWVHQIKTPIASMKLHLENEDSAFSRQLQSDLFRIDQYADMVLAYVRLHSQSTDYLFRTCEIEELVRKAVHKYASEFIDRKLYLHFTPFTIQTVTDEKWMTFVLEQILSNALKYTQTGGISIYAEDGDTLCIEDTGIGISASDLPRIFENGFTGYNGRLHPKASGIGLYLCKKVCTGLNHEISAESVIGKGTCITIHFHKDSLS